MGCNFHKGCVCSALLLIVPSLDLVDNLQRLVDPLASYLYGVALHALGIARAFHLKPPVAKGNYARLVALCSFLL